MPVLSKRSVSSRLRAFALSVCAITTFGTVFGATFGGNLSHAAGSSTTSETPLPWWWHGRVCDSGLNSSSHALGASYLGVQVCGPQPYKYNGGDSFDMVQEGPDPAHSFGEGEWQCVELAMRFMTLVYGVTPYGANGDGVVDNYSAADGGGLVKYNNGTPGIAPLPGDVLSFTDSISAGHVGIVTSSAVDDHGNGSVTMLSQNDTDDGWRTLPVTNWSVGGFTHHSAHNWLHDPAGRGAGGASQAASAWGGVTARPGGGYWAVTPFGKVAGGGAPVFGDASKFSLNAPIVDIAATPSGKGYWLLGADGGIFSFGDAAFHGSTGNIKLNQPVVGMAATRTGKGYWLTASDGGIFSFGDAAFHGSTGNITLNEPVVGMAATPTGRGYWLTASDGGIFGFGDAAFRGSTSGDDLAHPIAGMARTANGRGYWLVEIDGVTVHAFGNAHSG
jgi:hypothetical protein